MKIIIRGDNLDIDSRMKKIINEKIGKDLEKFLVNFDEDTKTAYISVFEDKRWGFRISFNMDLPKKKKIFAQVRKKSFLFGVTELRDEVKRQIIKYKYQLNN